MTAEIAILNRSCAALAADSAVTIGGGQKIYNTQNKIFEVSELNPIGLMFYNRMDYLDTPVEVIAKEFRLHNKSKNYSTVTECFEDFVQCLKNEVPSSISLEWKNTLFIARYYLKGVLREIDDATIHNAINNGKFLKSKTNSIAKDILTQKIRILAARDPALGFS